MSSSSSSQKALPDETDNGISRLMDSIPHPINENDNVDDDGFVIVNDENASFFSDDSDVSTAVEYDSDENGVSTCSEGCSCKNVIFESDVDSVHTGIELSDDEYMSLCENSAVGSFLSASESVPSSPLSDSDVYVIQRSCEHTSLGEFDFAAVEDALVEKLAECSLKPSNSTTKKCLPTCGLATITASQDQPTDITDEAELVSNTSIDSTATALSVTDSVYDAFRANRNDALNDSIDSTSTALSLTDSFYDAVRANHNVDFNSSYDLSATNTASSRNMTDSSAQTEVFSSNFSTQTSDTEFDLIEEDDLSDASSCEFYSSSDELISGESSDEDPCEHDCSCCTYGDSECESESESESESSDSDS